MMIKRIFFSVMSLVASTAVVSAADLAYNSKPEPQSADWSGFYAGISGGYSQSSALSSTSYFGGPNPAEIDFSGWFLGGEVGYDFDLRNGFVVGVQGDIAKSWGRGGGDLNLGATYDTADWQGAFTGHAGYKVSDELMPYVLGGLAVAGNTIRNIGIDFDASATNTHIGYTAGLGLQARLTDNISGFVEGRYTDYGTKAYGALNAPLGPQLGPVSLTNWSARTGIDFHFH